MTHPQTAGSGPTVDVSAGTPDNPQAAAAEIDALTRELAGSEQPPAPIATSAPAPSPAPADATSPEYGDEYPEGDHTLPDGRVLRKLSNGSWYDPARKTFVGNPLPRPKRPRGRPRGSKNKSAEPIVISAPVQGEPVRRSVGAYDVETQRLREEVAQLRAQLNAQRSEEMDGRIQTALEMTISLGGTLLAKARGPHWAVDDAEAETLAEAWTPVVKELLPADLHGDSIYLPAIVATVLVVGPKVKADQQAQAARARAADDQRALEAGAAA